MNEVTLPSFGSMTEKGGRENLFHELRKEKDEVRRE
jgi:hypothetical protein